MMQTGKTIFKIILLNKYMDSTNHQPKCSYHCTSTKAAMIGSHSRFPPYAAVGKQQATSPSHPHGALHAAGRAHKIFPVENEEKIKTEGFPFYYFVNLC
jgi:hypothetical protein